MAEKLDYAVGDLEFGANQQITKSIVLPTKNAGISFFPSQSLTVSTTAVQLPNRTNHNYAFITVETDKVRFRFGAAPTSTAGHELEAGDTLELNSASEILSIQFIRSGSADAALTISYGEWVTE